MLVFLAANFLFVASGGLILAFALVSEREKRALPTITNVAQRILLGQCPLTSAIVNSILMFITSHPMLFWSAASQTRYSGPAQA